MFFDWSIGRLKRLKSIPPRLQKAYFRIMRLTLVISLPITVGMVLLAPEFTRIFLSEKWTPIVIAMQLLAVAGLIKTIVSTGSPLFTGSGYPNYEFYMQLIRVLTIIIVIYSLIIYMGIPGAALGVILSVAGMLVIWYPLSQKITKAPWRKYLDTLWPPLLSSFFMVGSVYLVKIFWEPVGETLAISILTFSKIVIMSIFIYLAALFFLQKIYPAYDVFNKAKFLYKSLMRR